MLLLIVISGLLLTLNGNCQQNENIPIQGSSYSPSGQAADNANPSKRYDISRTQNGNETGFIRKDTRNSEVITIGRNDGYRTIFTTYENKGFYAHTGFQKSSPVPGSGNTAQQRTYAAIGGVPVPTNNEFINRDFNSKPGTTPVTKGSHPVDLKAPHKAAYPYPSIGGNSVEFKQNNSLYEPWMRDRKPGHQTNAVGEPFGGLPLNYKPDIAIPNQPTSQISGHQMTGTAQSIGGRPVDLTNNTYYSPYQPWSNYSTPTSAYYAANPSIGGHAVPLHPNFGLIPFGNEKFVSNAGIATRIGSLLPDDLEDSAEAGETERLSWQVSVFSKEVSPYARVCGGSIVTSTAVISAARCFWSTMGALPANEFAVGAEFVENPNTTPYEYNSYMQRIDVRTIRIPPRFRGASTNYQEDIAVLLMQMPFFSHQGLRPVCVSFDPALDEQQLADGSQGMILGSNFPVPDPSLTLRNLRVPVISIEQCLRLTADEHLQYITRDKFCAGALYEPPNASHCVRSYGSGLAFTSSPNNASPPVPFLRGVASSPLWYSAGGAYTVNTYTHIQSHRAFILQHVPDIERECSKHYPHVLTLLNDGADGSQSEDDEETDSDEGQYVCNCYC